MCNNGINYGKFMTVNSVIIRRKDGKIIQVEQLEVTKIHQNLIIIGLMM